MLLHRQHGPSSRKVKKNLLSIEKWYLINTMDFFFFLKDEFSLNVPITKLLLKRSGKQKEK